MISAMFLLSSLSFSTCQENSYLLNGRYRGYANEVAIAQSRQDISVPIIQAAGQAQQGVQTRVDQTQRRVQSRVDQAQRGVQSGVAQAGAEIVRTPGNIWNSFTGLFGIFG